jgi:hypothetical protein
MQLEKGRVGPAFDFIPFDVEVDTHTHLGLDSIG